MANKSRFIIAESKIKNYFIGGEKNVYSIEEIRGILEMKRIEWNLPQSMYVDKFIKKLINREILKEIELKFEGYINNKIRFINNKATEFQIAVSLIPKSYLSHYTAAFLNGLTTQVPKTIYTSFEQSKKIIKNVIIDQKAIDAAFKKQQRKSEAKAIYNEFTILVHNGKFTNRAGVYALDDLSISNIERTLIDITVRPNYSGGVHSVLEIYKKAIESISINKLVAILDNINYIYPYHQSIGFYLEKAGYDIKKLDDLRKKKMQFDFYLTYEMQDTEYSPDWKLFYPKGF